MRAGHIWLASFLVYPIVGAALLKARTFRMFGFPTRAVLSGGVGMVLVSWTMTVFALLRSRWGPLVVLVAGAVALVLRLLLRGRAESQEPKVVPSRLAGKREGFPLASRIFRPRLKVALLGKRAAGGDGVEGVGRAVTLIAYSLTALSLFAAFAATAAGRSTSADLLLFWGPKAQQFAAARTIDASFLGAPFMEYLHVYYPPLVTSVWAFGAMVAGRFPWGAATLTFPLLLAATAIGLAGILKAQTRRAPAAATTALVTSAIALVGIRALIPGNAEPFLLFFEILSVALLLTPVSATTGGRLLAGLFLAGAATSKVEGLPFVLAAAALFVLIDRKGFRRTVQTVLVLVGPTLVALGAWFAFGEARGLFRGYRGYGEVLAVRWENLGAIMAAIGFNLWKAGYALPWLVPLAVMILAPPRRRRALLPIGTALVLGGFLLFTYLTTAGDPTQLIGWSAARVFSPLTALFALAAFSSRESRPDTPPPSPY